MTMTTSAHSARPFVCTQCRWICDACFKVRQPIEEVGPGVLVWLSRDCATCGALMLRPGHRVHLDEAAANTKETYT
jgi:hypothetical protein